MKTATGTTDPLWYKDAIIYQVHIKAFKDSSMDGMGDFRGLIEKLDYLEKLGVTAIWLLPFYPSPLKDDGYDISDYYDVHADYGTMDDFKYLIDEAHTRGLKIITELVLNHTSDQHPYFKRARLAPPGSAERNFYVWSDTTDKYTDARIIFSDFEISNWTYDPIAKAYYWHRFYSHQPDLNFDNPAVHQACFDIVDFWFTLGVDGLRLDAVPYLYERDGTNCENLPETHEFLKRLHEHVSASFENKVLLAEANQWPEDAVRYFGAGDECQMAFHFPLMPRLYMALQMEDRFPIVDIIDQTPAIPDTCQWAIFLRNHDELTLEMVTDRERDYMYKYYAKDKRARINLGIRRRLAPLVENNRRKMELLNILLFSFPGTPIIYYGDEIGMGDNYYLGDRNGVRTPMQWSADRNAGFSDANPQKLFLPVIIDPEYHYEAVNVDIQLRNPSSLLWWMKRAIALRKNMQAFGRGRIEFPPVSNTKVLSFVRTVDDTAVLVVANLSRFSQFVELSLDRYAGCTPIEAFSSNSFPVINEAPYTLTLTGHDYYWFILSNEQREVRRAQTVENEIPDVRVRTSWMEVLEGGGNNEFEGSVLADYIRKQEWMKGNDLEFQAVTIADVLRLSDGEVAATIAVLRIQYLFRAFDYFLLPIAAATGEKAELIRKAHPEAVIARAVERDTERLLFDGVHDEQFLRVFYHVITREPSVSTRNGELRCVLDRRIKAAVARSTAPVQTVLLVNDGTMSQLVFDGALLVKLFRKLEEGTNTGVEMLRALSERDRYRNIPLFVGELQYRHAEAGTMSLGIVKEYVVDRDTGWTLILDSVKNYFDDVITKNDAKPTIHLGDRTVYALREYIAMDREMGDMTKKINTELVRLLGRRTGELHGALSTITDDPAFAPERFENFYQRSLYQSARGRIKDTLRLIRRNAAMFGQEHAAGIRSVVDAENEMLAFVRLLLERRIDARKMRIHGNLTLSQFNYTGKDFIVFNFEGGWNQSQAERRAKASPLVDAASMIWSLYSAVYTGFHQYTTTRPEGIDALEPYAKQWWLWITTIFVREYLKTLRPARLVPSNKRDVEYLMKFYLLERSLMELDHSIHERPQKIATALDALVFLIGQLRPGGGRA